MYKLYMLVDGEWWLYGTYHDVFTLTSAAFWLGQNNYEQIKVVQE